MAIPDVDTFQVWTPDGRRLLFSSERAGQRNLFWQAADGTGAIERLTEGPNIQNPTTMSPDGTRLVFTEISSDTGDDVMMLALSGPRQAQPPGRSSTSAPRQAQAGAPSAAAALGSEGVVSPLNHEVQPLIQTPFTERNGEVSPDGRRFLMIKPGAGTDSTATPTSLVVQNWFEELKRLVPTP